jgi:hypothetical protein
VRIELNRLGGGPVKFEDFADQNGLVMEVTERGSRATPQARFYARFRHVEVMESGCLVGMFGNGATPEQAIKNYKDRLRGEKIAVHALNPGRREIQCPMEWEPTLG